MQRDALTRRFFLQGTGSILGTSLARAGLPALAAVSQAACSARDEAASNNAVTYKNISVDEAREIIAIAARILPTTDTPGATEAGAVYFFDEAFGTIFKDLAGPARGMLTGFQTGVAQRYPGAERFSDLDEADQDEYLKSMEETPFFFGARALTMMGVFCMAKYGGNRDNVGWHLVGMDGPSHAFTHPFGDYDAAYVEEENDGA